MATAFRFYTVISMPLTAYKRLTGEITVITKGGKVMHGRLDQKGMARMRAYLNIRPETDSEALFVTDAGEPSSYGRGRMIWRRMQQRSGVNRLGSHLIRHSYAQKMARRGAPIADIQGCAGARERQDVSTLRWRGPQVRGCRPDRSTALAARKVGCCYPPIVGWCCQSAEGSWVVSNRRFRVQELRDQDSNLEATG